MTTQDQFEITSQLSEVKLMANHLMLFCSNNQLEKEISNQLELALVEAVNNIIVHAYNEKPGLKIQALFSISGSKFTIQLSDYGKKFNNKNNARDKLKTNAPSETHLDNLTEGNWGLNLMRSLTDNIIRQRENDTNILIMTKKIKS